MPYKYLARARKSVNPGRNIGERHRPPRLVKRTALAAGVRGDLSEGERGTRSSGHSLRADLASPAKFDERYVQKQLGHAPAQMTGSAISAGVNLAKASGL